MNKSTEELTNELKNSDNINEYVNDNKSELTNMALSQYLEKLLISKDLTRAKVIAKSNLSRTYAYQIFDGKKNPTRDKLAALCFGFQLFADETQRVLKIAKLPILYPRLKRDSLILFALQKRYTIIECNNLLDDFKENIIE